MTVALTACMSVGVLGYVALGDDVPENVLLVRARDMFIDHERARPSNQKSGGRGLGPAWPEASCCQQRRR